MRPGEKYILLGTTGSKLSNQLVTALELNCEGVQGLMLNLPEALTLDWEETLRHLGLEQSRTVEVWPAGLAPVAWDGDGYGEWLETDVPCLGILSDHPLATLNVSIDTDGKAVFELMSVDSGEPVFLELPQLPVGVYGMHIFAQNMAGGDSGQLGELDVVIRILEERPQSQVISPIGPLSLQMEPPSPTLEQLWEGQVDLSLQGPDGHRSEINVAFSGANDETSAFSQPLPPITLPFQSDDWRYHFNVHFQSRTEAQDAYDIARVCTVDFDAGESGEFRLSFERAFTPLRWAVRRRRNGYFVQLIDDRGDPKPPEISRRSFENPCVAEPLVWDFDSQAQESGGLLVAGTDRLISAIIVPPTPNRIRLEDLRLEPSIERYERSMDSVVGLVGNLELWGKARLPGDLLSAIRQRSVLRGLLDELFRVLCGERWARVERQTVPKGTPDALRALSDAVSQRREEMGLGTSLIHNAERFATSSCQERVGVLSSLVAQYRILRPYSSRMATPTAGGSSNHPDDPEWLAEFSLRLATDPGNVKDWAGENLVPGLTRLYETPIVAKAARYLVLVTDCYLQVDSKLGGQGPYDGWRWE